MCLRIIGLFSYPMLWLFEFNNLARRMHRFHKPANRGHDTKWKD